MIGKTHRRFWRAFEKLPNSIQALAREKYNLWKSNPFHPSLGFEERRNNVCVVRIGNSYRAVGLREAETVVWFWIGTHEEYNKFRF